MSVEDISLSVVIPAYNEAERLPAFLDSSIAWLRDHLPRYEIIVVDDGSDDGTSELALGFDGVRVLQHIQNSGKGAAVRTGMREARGDFHLFADADGATQMREVTKLTRGVERGAEIAIGSREGEGVKVEVSPFRKISGRWFNRVLRMGTLDGIRDTQCGFKLFTKDASQRLFASAVEDGFAFDVEVLLLARAWGMEIDEIPVNWAEQEGSKVRVVRDGWRMLKAVERIRLRLSSGVYERGHRAETPFRELPLD